MIMDECRKCCIMDANCSSEQPSRNDDYYLTMMANLGYASALVILCFVVVPNSANLSRCLVTLLKRCGAFVVSSTRLLKVPAWLLKRLFRYTQLERSTTTSISALQNQAISVLKKKPASAPSENNNIKPIDSLAISSNTAASNSVFRKASAASARRHYENKASWPIFGIFGEFLAEKAMETTENSTGINCANYCSLPRRLNNNNNGGSELKQQKRAAVDIYFLMQDQQQQELMCDDPAAYLRTMKKSSVDSRLRTCANSPDNFRSEAVVSAQLRCHQNHQRADENNLPIAFRRHQNFSGKPPHHHGASQNGAGAVSSQMNYEMSTDLMQKQLELACRRYGGVPRASQAALVIQRAYRQYAMARNFERVRKRRSGTAMFVKSGQNCTIPIYNNFNNQFVSKICINGASHNGRDSEIKSVDYDQEKSRIMKLNLDDQNQISGLSRNNVHFEELSLKFSENRNVEECRLFFANETKSNNIENCCLSKEASCSSHDSHHQPFVSYIKINDTETSTGRTNGHSTLQSTLHSDFNVVNNRGLQLQYFGTTRVDANSQSKVAIDSEQQKNAVVDYSAESCSYLDAKSIPYAVTSPVMDKKSINQNGSGSSSNGRQRKGSLTKFLQSPVWPRKKYSTSDVVPLQFAASTSSAVIKHGPESNFSSEDNRFEPKTSPTEHSVKHYRLSTNRMDDLIRRRQYRIALNFFNKKPERGVEFLISWGFVDHSPKAVARFFLTRKGLSKQMIGEYLGNLQNKFGQQVLNSFADQIDMSNMHIDVALRLFQSYFRLPGEAQKIERIVEVFANQYCKCNPALISRFNQTDTIFIMAFAIIMLHTDLHSPNVKASKRMKVDDFVRNLRGIDAGHDVDPNLLADIFNRVKKEEFKADPDHVIQVLKVESSIVGKKPTLSLPHRRLVCFCRLNEILDHAKRQSASVHQREIFLFNDMLLISKILSRKKTGVTYSYRESHCLVGAQINAFTNQYYSNGVEVNLTLENKKIYFNTRTEEDRVRFIEDLREATHETDEMEALRIELELQKQTGMSYPIRHLIRQGRRNVNEAIHFDPSRRDCVERASGIFEGSNSDPAIIHRHSSATSLDSGMSSASLCSRESFQQIQASATLSQIQEVPMTGPDVENK